MLTKASFGSDVEITARVEEQLQAIGKIGYNGQGKGWSRLAFSEEENRVHDYAERMMRDVGLTIHRDAFGNLYGRNEAARASKRLMLGTHLDTVPEGGNFDGVVGFVVPLEAYRQLLLDGRDAIPFELVVFRAEESSRFDKACLGSRAAFGQLSPDELRSRHYKLDDDTKVSLADAAKACGFDPQNSLSASLLKTDDYWGYMETHIEQARVLELSQSLGVVTSIRAPERRKIVVRGGRTIKAASAIILAVEWICRMHAAYGEDIVGTVGKAYNYFGDAKKVNKVNVIPGEVDFRLNALSAEAENFLQCVEKGMDIRKSFHGGEAAFGTIVTVTGRTDHSGGTPMGRVLRRDALVASAEMILSLEDRYIPDDVPEIGLHIDLRSNNVYTRSQVRSEIESAFYRIGNAFGSTVEVNAPSEETTPITSLDPKLSQQIVDAAKSFGYKIKPVPSGAGHDAMIAAHAGVPTAMLFVPSKDGISHQAEEFTPTQEIVKAVRIQAKILSGLSKNQQTL